MEAVVSSSESSASGASKKMSLFEAFCARMEAKGVEPVATIVRGPGTRAVPLKCVR